MKTKRKFPTNQLLPVSKFYKSIGRNRGMANIIIDIFEEMLEQKAIFIPDEYRTGDESEACLYGQTYFELLDQITNLLDDYY